MHSGRLIWVTCQEQVRWVSSPLVKILPPQRPRRHRQSLASLLPAQGRFPRDPGPEQQGGSPAYEQKAKDEAGTPTVLINL